MKILLLCLVLSTSISFSQSLEKNEIDEFTGQKVKATEWMGIAYSFDGDIKYRLCKIDSSSAIEIKMLLSGVNIYSVNKGDEMLIKMTSGEVLKAICSSTTFSCKGCGATGLIGSAAYGIDVFYYVDKVSLEKLKKEPIAKIRFYTSAGKIEREMKLSRAEKFMKAVSLLD